MFESIRAQFRIVTALAIREMQTQNTSMQHGLAWAAIDVLMYVGVISLLRVLIKAFMPPGMPPFTFLILGIMPWLVFYHTSKSVEKIIDKNKKLLSLPVVTPLDLVLATAAQKLAIYGLVFVGLIALSSYWEGAGMPRFPLGIILIFLASWAMGTSFGLIVVPMLRMFPPTKFFFQPLKRAIFWTSGLYFVITSMPGTLWPYLTWNPMLHICELMRTYWFTTYNTPVGSPAYVVEVMMGMAVLGLSLERLIRRVPA